MQAEALNPDGWASVEEARQGLQEFEARSSALLARLGPRRRRTRRGGGRRRRGRGEPVTAGAPPGELPASAGVGEPGAEAKPDVDKEEA